MVNYKEDTSERRKKNKSGKKKKTRIIKRNRKIEIVGKAEDFMYLRSVVLPYLKFVTIYKEKYLILGVPFNVLNITQNTNFQ